MTTSCFYEGAWLIFLGLFKKTFVADNLAPIVERTFRSGHDPTGAEVIVAVYAFAFQIYGDFSGYSDMARGLAKMLGFELTLNFRVPYFARDIRDFWHRWHITLSTWLRDYVYVSLGGNRAGRFITVRNLLLTMIVGGLWHGAAWTFVAWGFYHGLLLVIHRLVAPAGAIVRERLGRAAWCWSAASMALTFHFVCVGWLLFRSESLTQAWEMLGAVVFGFGGVGSIVPTLVALAFVVSVLLGIQLYKEATSDMDAIGRLPVWARGPLYLAMAVLMLVAGAPSGREFIYFQF